MVKEFINYFKLVASLEEARSRSIAKLNNSLTIPFRDNNADEFFITSGGVQDIGVALKERAKAQMVATSDNSKRILAHIVPPLEKLRSDLQLKIKEIKGLSGDFKNSVGKEQEHTRRHLQALSESLTAASQRPSEISPKNDPHLVKLAFERQLRHHLQEENFLHQAHRNIESSGRALEGLVVKIIRDAFSQYQELLNAEATATSNFAAHIGVVGAELPVDKEWESFIADAKDMVDPKIPIRTLKDIDYPGANQVTLIRSGRLERKSKYLKSYSSAFYILTAVGYFHEFKSSHMQDLQVSLFLPHCTLGGHSSPGERSHKFVLKGSQTGGMHRYPQAILRTYTSGHNWVFRAETHEEMLAWYHDIEQLVQLPHMSLSQRQTFIASHAPEDLVEKSRQSGSSSPGLDEDEADEVPYSHTHSIEETASPESPQRPPPGGSFPSETKLDDEGMYAGHSPTASDVTHDNNPPTRISTDEDVAEVFATGPRPTTSGTQKSYGSMGDDGAFTTAALGVGVGAAAVGVATAATHARAKDREMEAGPHEAVGYYAGNVPDTELGRNDTSIGRPQFITPLPTSASQTSTMVDPTSNQKTRGISTTINDPVSAGLPVTEYSPASENSDIRFGNLAFGSAGGNMGGPALGSVQRPEDFYFENQPTSAEVTGDAIETQPPRDSDVLPAELQNPRTNTSVDASLMAPPTSNVIKRSKSKKEIVEETIAESIGNHPERGKMPGFWPETPAEQDKDGYL